MGFVCVFEKSTDFSETNFFVIYLSLSNDLGAIREGLLFVELSYSSQLSTEPPFCDSCVLIL
jgi:hypothetical protein